MRRVLLAAFLTTIATAGAVVGTAAPASAAFSLTTCVGSSVTSYSPAVTRVPKPTTATYATDYRACLTTEPGLTAGVRRSSVTVPNGACGSPIDRSPVTFRIDWDNGTSSTIEGTALATSDNITITTTIDATVTAGAFTGAAVHQVLTAAGLGATLCTIGLASLSSITGVVSLTIIGV